VLSAGAAAKIGEASSEGGLIGMLEPPLILELPPPRARCERSTYPPSTPNLTSRIEAIGSAIGRKHLMQSDPRESVRVFARRAGRSCSNDCKLTG
jgi:hypothetical protein